MEEHVHKKGVTVKYARDILGKDYKQLTDKQVQSVLDFLYKMAQIDINQFRDTQSPAKDDNAL
ncbi:MAG: hypothetical protein EOP48_01410 [Sphingobacteriales bacterium]|nr:MAG: hypothetical protein EOP48_01410 [Sphingobacteriales bacterium]